QADAERLHRIVQRAFPRRVPQRALVHQSRARAGRYRNMATRVQRRAAEEGTRRADARRLRTAVDGDDEDGESNRRTLNESATEGGGTSVRAVKNDASEAGSKEHSG